MISGPGHALHVTDAANRRLGIGKRHPNRCRQERKNVRAQTSDIHDACLPPLLTYFDWNRWGCLLPCQAAILAASRTIEEHDAGTEIIGESYDPVPQGLS